MQVKHNRMKNSTQTIIQVRTSSALLRLVHLFANLSLPGLLTASAAGSALQYETLKSLGASTQYGSEPYAELIEGNDGALYGTAQGVLHDLEGDVVFKVNKSGSNYTVLHRFGSDDGLDPRGALLLGSDGALYGTTQNGGTNAGCGTVYRLNADGSGFVTLHHFCATDSDGAFPYAAVMEGSDGLLYGTTHAGGEFGRGTVFKLGKDGSGYAIVHHFTTNAFDGRRPFINGLMEGSDGLIYGTTISGGSNDVGTVFSMSKDGSGYTILHHFSNSGGDGRGPRGLLEATNGLLYGTTHTGGSDNVGSVFRMNKDGSSYAILHSFSSAGGDGRNPRRLVEGSDGALYGTTLTGGANLNYSGFAAGTLFKINPDGSAYEVLHHFSSFELDGFYPQAGLLEGSDGAFYGTTQQGGDHYDFGTVFKVNTDGSQYSVVRSFFDPFVGDARTPYAGLTPGGDGKLYGTSTSGGENGAGALFRLDADGNGYEITHHFNYLTGSNPQGRLLSGSDGMLYGTAHDGGTNASGVIFKLHPNGTDYTILHHFAGYPLDGWGPDTALVEGSDGALYGTTWGGGNHPSAGGIVFKVRKDGSGYTILRHFGNDFGSAVFLGEGPTGDLIEGSDGRLYGMTVSGGAFTNQWGYRQATAFRMNKNGSGFSVIHHFGGGEDGENFAHHAGLTEASDRRLYGTSVYGGANSQGMVFGMNKDGSGYSVLRALGATAEDARAPMGELVEGPDGALYGTTFYGGKDNAGTVFKLNRDGSGYLVVHEFSTMESKGGGPWAGLLKLGDGAFYGTTREGGNLGLGTVFKLSWPVVITRYERSGNTAQLGWNGVPNWPYRIQIRTNLNDSADTWVNLGGTNFTALDGAAVVTIAEPQSDPTRFYRIAWP
jgi:uncharacterized repeat protein (TIGR03803 family)